MLGENCGTVISSNKSKELMNDLRKAISNNFPRIWFYLYKNNNKYDLAVANSNGGMLDKDTIKKIKTFSKTFLSDVAAKSKN